MIYVASPYSHKDKKVMQLRYDEVAEFCAKATGRDFKVISPICHWHPIAVKYNLPKEVDYWRDWNTEVLRLSRELWVLTIPGYKESIGVQEEISEAIVLELPVYYRTKNDFSFSSEGGTKCTT